jgi:hypothetical protein
MQLLNSHVKLFGLFFCALTFRKGSRDHSPLLHCLFEVCTIRFEFLNYAAITIINLKASTTPCVIR